MAENDKKRKDIDDDIEVKEEEEKAEEKKDEKKPESELEKMLRQVEEEFGVDRSQVKVVRMNRRPQGFKAFIVDFLLTLIINIVLILGISGWIQWASYNSIWDLVWFTVAFTIIEIALKYLISIFFRKLVIRSFGLILSLATLLAIPLVLLLTDFVEITAVNRLLLIFVIVIIVRSMIRSYLARRKISRHINRKR